MNSTKIRFYLDQAGVTPPTSVVKRDGSIVPFDLDRIESALARCFDSLDVPPVATVEQVVTNAANVLAARQHSTPGVEEVQDTVETALMMAQEFAAAKHYVLYREEHAKARMDVVPVEIKTLFEADKVYFPSPIQEFQFYYKYASLNWDLLRRATWPETDDRHAEDLLYLHPGALPVALGTPLWRPAPLHHPPGH